LVSDNSLGYAETVIDYEHETVAIKPLVVRDAEDAAWGIILFVVCYFVVVVMCLMEFPYIDKNCVLVFTGVTCGLLLLQDGRVKDKIIIFLAKTSEKRCVFFFSGKKILKHPVKNTYTEYEAIEDFAEQLKTVRVDYKGRSGFLKFNMNWIFIAEFKKTPKNGYLKLTHA